MRRTLYLRNQKRLFASEMMVYKSSNILCSDQTPTGRYAVYFVDIIIFLSWTWPITFHVVYLVISRKECKGLKRGIYKLWQILFRKRSLTCLKQGNHLNSSTIGARDDFRPNSWTWFGGPNAEKTLSPNVLENQTRPQNLDYTARKSSICALRCTSFE